MWDIRASRREVSCIDALEPTLVFGDYLPRLRFFVRASTEPEFVLHWNDRIVPNLDAWARTLSVTGCPRRLPARAKFGLDVLRNYVLLKSTVGT